MAARGSSVLIQVGVEGDQFIDTFTSSARTIRNDGNNRIDYGGEK